MSERDRNGRSGGNCQIGEKLPVCQCVLKAHISCKRPADVRQKVLTSQGYNCGEFSVED